MKKTVAITIDFDVYILAKRKIDNISSEVNEYLKKRVKVEENEIKKTIEEMRSDRDMKLAEAKALEEAATNLEKKEKDKEEDIIYKWSDEG